MSVKKIIDSKIVNTLKEKAKTVTSDSFEYIMKNITNDKHYQEKASIMKTIEKYQTIIIQRHIRVDGDAYGSSLGLRAILRASFPDKKIYSVGGDVPPYLHFIGQEDVIEDQVYENSLVIIVDTATAERIQDQRYKKAKEIIKIDHHIIVEQYGTINYVRENLPACAAIIYDWFLTFQNNLTLTVDAALALYVGIVCDTGRFRFSLTNSETFHIAADLIKKGIDTEKMYAHLYIKNTQSLKLLGYVYENFKISENGVAYIYITEKIRKKYRATEDEASNLVNALDSIHGSLIWVLFLDAKDEIRVRMRSRFITVDDIANNYRGGGHAHASGATIYEKKEIKMLINDADQKLRAYKLLHKDVF